MPRRTVAQEKTGANELTVTLGEVLKQKQSDEQKQADEPTAKTWSAWRDSIEGTVTPQQAEAARDLAQVHDSLVSAYVVQDDEGTGMQGWLHLEWRRGNRYESGHGVRVYISPDGAAARYTRTHDYGDHESGVPTVDRGNLRRHIIEVMEG